MQVLNYRSQQGAFSKLFINDYGNPPLLQQGAQGVGGGLGHSFSFSHLAWGSAGVKARVSDFNHFSR